MVAASVVISRTHLHPAASSISLSGGGLGRPGRRGDWLWGLGVRIEASDDPFERTVAAHALLVEQHLAGDFEALLVAFAQGAQDVLTIQIPLGFDLVPIQDRLLRPTFSCKGYPFTCRG